MKKSEKDALKQKIQSENILVRRLGSWVKVGGIIFLVTAGLCVWGFTGMKDPILPDISEMDCSGWCNSIWWIHHYVLHELP